MAGTIAAERRRMEASKRDDFMVTLLTMLTATAIALLLSMVFYRWIDRRFRHYQDDIDTRNRALKESARELRLSAQVFEASNEAIAILDHRFRIVSVNPALERISGYHHADIVGRHCAELLIGEQTGSDLWRRTASCTRRTARSYDATTSCMSHRPMWYHHQCELTSLPTIQFQMRPFGVRPRASAV